ncbi:MAG: transaldolase [Chlamydiae bacterium RIFCSPLOWO2_01_FULL_28_7]|nr:MAG: transaldolase [Chlamydiae bacterium RIFCSPLOWO2_01_FULL_28_7]
MLKTQNLTELDQLKTFSKVVIDTSDFDLMDKFKPLDATTNPSLILKSIKNPNYKHLIEDAILYSKKNISNDNIETAAIKLFVNFGLEILKIVPGRVSIEIDAKYSFDTIKNIELAKKIISLFEKNNISRERILIKMATTWECILAAKELEKDNIHCNMTLLFSIYQAIACAEARATLVSPFVGRILDWYKKNENKTSYLPKEDPGVISVANIFNYFKKFDYNTQIMGASFRNKEEILELAGCDLITIAPSLLEELTNSKSIVLKKLCENEAKASNLNKISLDEKSFRYHLNQDPMAGEKLSEGIRLFERDLNVIKDLLKKEWF